MKVQGVVMLDAAEKARLAAVAAQLKGGLSQEQLRFLIAQLSEGVKGMPQLMQKSANVASGGYFASAQACPGCGRPM